MVSDRGPLTGYRALDLVDGLGAYGPRLLAGLGVEVIRVEPPGGSPQRRASPVLDRQLQSSTTASLHFIHYNAGKKSITLDLDSPSGRDQLSRLLDQVDMVFDNGALAASGFDLPSLAQKSPPLVVVCVTPFGLEGERASWLGDDLVCQAMSGMVSYYGYRGERPARFGPHQSSEMSGLAAALGALIALFESRRSGRGDLIDIAAARVGALTTFQMSNASLYHQFGFRRLRHQRGSVDGNLYWAKDGYLQVGAFRSLQPLLKVLERFGAVEDLHEIDIPDSELARNPRVQSVLRRFVAEHSRIELAEAMQAEGVMCVPVNDVKDLLDDPFLRSRGFFTRVELPDGSLVADAGIPIRFQKTPYTVRPHVPAPGEDNAEVLSATQTAAGRSRRPRGRSGSPQRPLEGIRIIDCGWIIAGPLATRLLADFGAQVIKIESTARPDVARGNRVPLFGELPGDANSNADTGGYFQDANASKLSCTLNLSSGGGRELLRRLVAVSDAIVCNLHGDQLDRWGVGYDEARRLNPRIIVVAVPTMETRGPRRRWRAFGDSFAALSGLKSVSGPVDEPPTNFGHQYPDFSANPFHTAIALMAALHHRERTGEGQFIEVSQYESTAALLGAAVLEYTANDIVPCPRGNANPDAAPHNFYRCRGEDSWCAISILKDSQWQALISIDALAGLRLPEYATLEGRRAHEKAIDDLIEAWTADWDRQELASFLQARGVPAGPYQDIVDMVERDPTLGGRYFVKLQHPSGREFLVHGSPIQARRNPAQVGLGPLLGEHTNYVLEHVLGLSPEEIAEYAAAGALE